MNPLNQRDFLRTSLAGAAPPTSPGGRAPNILFLYTDQQRADTLACYGNQTGLMPNVDRLALHSTVFDRAYCTNPVCTPSRGSIHTGLFSHTHGAFNNNIFLRRDVKCLPEYLPADSHVAGHFGKWHLGDEIFAQHGFLDWRATEDTYHMTYDPPVKEFGPERSRYHHWLIEHGVKPTPPGNLKVGDPKWHPAFEQRFFRDQIHKFSEELSRPAFLADQSVDFIHTNKGHPWALYVNFLEPHPPYASCRDHQFDQEKVLLDANWQRKLTSDVPLRLRVRAAGERATEANLRGIVSRYMGMCSLVDTQIGRILSALGDQGERDNTIIVFTTDHGDMLGGFGLSGKSCMFDASARVPLLISRPRQRIAHRITEPVSQVDLTPTMLDLVGQPIPAGLHGSSLAPVLTGKEKSPERDVFLQWGTGPATQDAKFVRLKPGLEKLGTAEEITAATHERIRTIITRHSWKFSRNSLGVHELYDLTTDPNEQRNLATHAAHKDRVADLQQRITVWQQQVGDIG